MLDLSIKYQQDILQRINNMEDYEYNILSDDVFFIKEEYKGKGQEYGIVKLNKKFIPILAQCIELISSSPSLSVKFSKRIENFLAPRFEELSAMVYQFKDLPETIGLELSKENHKDILKGLDFPNVSTTIKNKGYAVQELKSQLNDVKFLKFK